MDVYASGTAQVPGWVWGLYAVFGIVYLVSYWRILTKGGEEGWAILIPIYNTYVICRMIKRPELFKYLLYSIGGVIVGAILMAVAGAVGGIVIAIAYIALIVFAIQMVHGISKAFGQDVGFTLGLLFLGFIFIPLLAFGNYRYVLNDSNAAGSADTGVLDS